MMTSFEQSQPYTRGSRIDYTWSARFLLERLNSFGDTVLQKLGGIVSSYAHPEWPISGALLNPNEIENQATLVLGLDPSQTFGTPDKDRCEEIATDIADTLGWQRQSEVSPEMRIILGRRIGYDGSEYSMEEVRALTLARGCGNLALTEANLFSLRYVDGLREYHEPSVIVEGPANGLTGALQVAAAMGQERLVAEITDVETQVFLLSQ